MSNSHNDTDDPYGDAWRSDPSGASHSREDLDDNAGATDDDEMAAVAHEERVAGPADLYAVLNLERDASDEDIRNAYRRLSMIFHPDKHHSPADKEAAQRQFQAIKRAYDVLSNPNHRHIYNAYGHEGLRTSWDVTEQRSQTEQQARDEFNRRERFRLESEAERLIKSKGEVHVGLDATRCFDSALPRKKLGRFTSSTGLMDALVLPEISHAFVKHSWETKIFNSTDLIIQGNAITKNGLGAGTVAATVRHIVNPTMFTEATLQANAKQPTASFKLSKNMQNDVFTSAECTFTAIETPPPLTFVAGRRIDSKHTGFLSFRTGDYQLGPWGANEAGVSKRRPSCGLGLIGKSVKGQWSCEISMGLNGSSLSLGIFRSIGWGVRARAGCSVSTGMGLSTSISADKTLSKFDRVGMSVDAASIGGVSFKLRFMRLGQKFVLPIALSPDLDVTVAIFATFIPLCVALALDFTVFQPDRRAKLAARIEKLRSDNAAAIQQRKQEALSAIQLMSQQVARKQEVEEQKNGLVIVEALYGKLPESAFARNSTGSAAGFSMSSIFERETGSGAATPPYGSVEFVGAENGPWADVTVPVQNMVYNSQLFISGGHSKVHIVGFYDPCLGEPKKLRVTYKFQGKIHQVEVDDTNSVAAPLRAHIIKNDL
ncbi:hypothetical protein HDU84_001906 [Entophlyctis sp. JEL0112]|nr:hypothetical protein HDU84_001906 [Entophlyctis sp. JEL0112]